MCDISWPSYKNVLRRVYFGDGEECLAPRECPTADDFWAFFRKYTAMAVKKRAGADREMSWKRPRLDAHGLPEDYSKFHKIAIKLGTARANKYALKEVPGYVVAEFEHIIHAYLSFCQKTKLGRLKKLRKAQAELPIAAHRQEILTKLAHNPVLIIAGDTGCGKSTQVPQYLLHGDYTSIACTQPRRIACISLSKRVGFETLGEFGSRIAYQIRFEKTKTSATKMLFLTEGLLLRQLSADPVLQDYQVIILDEVHERHLQGDFLMGMLRQLVSERADLKLILMSATINLALFTAYFDKAPVIQVPGRLFPISLQYFPTAARDKTLTGKESKNVKVDPAPYRRLLGMIDAKYPASERGDALVFLSGITEMTTVAEALKVYAEQNQKWLILMLHSTLSLEEQDKVFDVAPEGVRKVILSTNIAETSVTIDGVRFVIDSGKVKEMRYDPATRMHQLKEIWVSQASGNQRKGRAGRTGPGVCFRLYSVEEFEALQPFSTSEIQRVSLESLVLQMYHLQLPSPRHFDFIEPPSAAALSTAIEGLKDQGALQADKTRGGDADELSPLGKMLVNLPVDVGIGKMLVMGCLFRQVEVVLTVAAGLSVQSPFTQRSFKEPDCASARRHLMSDHGDPFCLVRVYKEWLRLKNEGEDTRRWCRQRGIEEQRLYEITKLRRQFQELLEDGELIERKSAESQGLVGSAERRIRAGEMRRLRDLKRKAQFEQRKRKVLKPNEHYDTIAAGAEEELGGDDTMAERAEGSSGKPQDVGAVEFALKVTGRELNEGIKEHHLNHESALLLKVIICSALYPQYAMLDQYNQCKLLFYGLLLETAKPYLINTLRVPALHTLLLFARQVDTSADLTRIVCDDFAEFTVLDPKKAEELVSLATEIRGMMGKSLERKLSGDTYRSGRLGRRILAYMHSELLYSVRRVVGTKPASFFPPPLAEGVEGTDGGRVGDFLRVGSLGSAAEAPGTSQFLATKWDCPKCAGSFYSNGVERLDHIRDCEETGGAGEEGEKEKEAEEARLEDKNPLKAGWFCEACEKRLNLTPIEILRHKRAHSAKQSASEQ